MDKFLESAAKLADNIAALIKVKTIVTMAVVWVFVHLTSTGAITAAFGIVPDLCVAVDVTHGDSPDASKDKTFKLGGGPVIGVGPNCTRWMSKRLERKAKKLDMDCQIEVMAGHSGTNGWDLQISREGVATAVLSLPLRYMHTPVETASRADMTACARLLAAFIRGIGKEVPSYD